MAAYQYQQFMVEKYGQEFVENMLETRKDIRKWYAADYRDLLTNLNERIKAEKQRIGV